MNSISDVILDNLHIGVVVLDEQLNIVSWNNWMENLTQKKKEDVLGVRLGYLYPVFEKKLYQQILLDTILSHQKMFCSAALHPVFFPPGDSHNNNGENIQQNLYIEPINYNYQSFALLQVFDATTQRKRFSHLKATLKEMTNTKEKVENINKKIIKKANYDGLTNLPNRSFFMEKFEEELEKAKQKENKLAALFIDLDNFKEINDQKGHIIGDELLKIVAKRLQSICSEIVFIGRYGGDEFVVLLPGESSSQENRHRAAKFAKEFINSINRPIYIDDDTFQLSISIGISCFPEDGIHPKQLLQNADLAMFEAKKQGGNKYSFYEKNKNETC